MATPNAPAVEKVTFFQLALLVLSVILLIALLADTVSPVPQEISLILQKLDLVACGLFFIDFLIRFKRAPSKAAFMKWGWIDLLACVPNIDALRVGRLVRVLRIIRLLRGVRIGHRVFELLVQNKPKSAAVSVLFTTLLLVTFGSIAVLLAEEPHPEANIKTAQDAVWWSVTTITTVGYGDRYPVTTGGRVVAMGLMICGVGLFGTLSGLIASVFLGPREDRESRELQEILRRLEALDAKLKAQKE